jgi:signal transduction histidine kinase
MKESFDLPVLPAWPDAIRRQVETFESMELLRQFLDSGPYAMVVNSKRQIVFASLGLRELLGERELDSVVGMRIGEAFQCAHLEETPGGCGASEYCRQCGGNNAILSAQTGLKDARECRITRRVGGREEPLDLLVKATPVVVAGDRYVFCSIVDISHEKRRYALERIFLHDVVNTAGTIRDLASILEDTVPEEGRTWMRLLSRSARHLVSELQGQRQLMEAESGELAVNVEPVDTGALLADIVGMYAGSAVGRERNLIVPAGPEDIRIDSDPALLSRVLANLVKNALEASAAGDTVTVNCRRLEDLVEFTVHNPAVMTPEVRRQVFQRSFSTKGHGRGLGTYSVKLLTERYLGGTVAFRSAEGEGTTFRARYPRFLNVRQ